MSTLQQQKRCQYACAATEFPSVYFSFGKRAHFIAKFVKFRVQIRYRRKVIRPTSFVRVKEVMHRARKSVDLYSFLTFHVVRN